MEVRWSTIAVKDLEHIFQRIEKDNPTAARETVKAIYDGCEALKVWLANRYFADNSLGLPAC
jgi:plasmid stabilization system protein ParE